MLWKQDCSPWTGLQGLEHAQVRDGFCMASVSHQNRQGPTPRQLLLSCC